MKAKDDREAGGDRGAAAADRRYLRNRNMISEAEQLLLADARVGVIGCGGLGGHAIEMLGRLGVGTILAVDGDVFEETNLNRQLLSEPALLGTEKAEAARARMQRVNPLIEVVPVTEKITQENGIGLLTGMQVVVDAVDSIESRLLLQDLAERLRIPLVHGAIAGWYGQVTTILPGDRTLELIYANGETGGIESQLGNPSFTPAMVASIQVSETLKLLLGRDDILRRRLLHIDLLDNDYTIIELGPAD